MRNLKRTFVLLKFFTFLFIEGNSSLYCILEQNYHQIIRSKCKISQKRRLTYIPLLSLKIFRKITHLLIVEWISRFFPYSLAPFTKLTKMNETHNLKLFVTHFKPYQLINKTNFRDHGFSRCRRMEFVF